MRRILQIGGAALVALTAGGAATARADSGRFEVILREAHGAAAHESAALVVLARSGARRAGPSVPAIGLVTVAPGPGRTTASLLRALRADPAVRAVAPVYRLSLRALPNDPALTAAETASGTPPGVPVQWPYARQNLPSLWSVAPGDGALVGIVDTGIDASHPDFAGKLRAAVKQNSGDNLPAASDPNGHGTHVSSLACAATDNGVGLAGAGGRCQLVVERTDLTNASIASSIVDATDRGVQAINLSLGGPGGQAPDPGFVAAIDYAYRHNVVLVAAASDNADGDQGQPASLLQPTGTGPDLGSSQIRGLSITSADFFDGPSGGGLGSQISMAAYGSFDTFGGGSGPRGLFGSFPSGLTELELPTPTVEDPIPKPCLCRTTFGGDNRYAYLQGTSMSTPQVTAVAAVLRVLNPFLSAGDVIRILKQTARRPAGTGWTSGLGWGILDAGTAADAVRGVDRRAPVSRLRAPHVSRRTRFTLRWSGSDPAGAPGLVSSGIRYFDIYASRDRGVIRRIAHTGKTSMRFTGRRSSRYRFFSVAVDRAGNREPRHARPDATTRVTRR